MNYEMQTLVDGIAHAILIFDADGRLLMENQAARRQLGADLNLIRQDGWDAAVTLFNAQQTDPDYYLDAARARAAAATEPVRFFIYRSGEQVPCWACSIVADDGRIGTLLTLDAPHWEALTLLLEKFRVELRDAIQDTLGHIELINNTLKTAANYNDAAGLAKRLSGFVRLIELHMTRAARFMELLERMENLRTGKLREILRRQRRKIDLGDFVENLLEEIDEGWLVDPETDAHDHRSRVKVNVAGNAYVAASPDYLLRILRDILRNAIMYSMKATPIVLEAKLVGGQVQVDIRDEGYGIRQREREQVFSPFQRARQPQVMAEFGYGLSLYLCKHEAEAMNGKLWFESTEGVGTVFSLILPVWRESSSSSEG